MSKTDQQIALEYGLFEDHGINGKAIDVSVLAALAAARRAQRDADVRLLRERAGISTGWPHEALASYADWLARQPLLQSGQAANDVAGK